MDPGTLSALLAFAAAVAPELLADLEDLIRQFTAQHPSLNNPPPPDGEGTVDAQVDAEIKAQFDK
jgi:hypothetical protein